MLFNTPLYQPNSLPPQNSDVIILCSNDDIKHISDVFYEYSVRLIISDKDSDFKQIFNYSNCHIVIFSSEFNFGLLYYFNNKLNELDVKHKYICMPIPRKSMYNWHYPEFLNDSMNELVKVFNLLCNDESRKIFVSRIKSIITGDIGYIRQSEYAHYFHPKTILQKGDTIIDGGVGKDLSFINKCSKLIGDEGYIYSFEPEPICHSYISNKITQLKNVTLFKLALWNKSEQQLISQNGGCSQILNVESSNTNTEFGIEKCQMTTIDTIVSKYNIKKVDIIKLDVEASEKYALLGGVRTIEKYRPKLLISVYHKVNHLFELPLFINDLNLNYKFYMGHHSPIQWETVLYAIPN